MLEGMHAERRSAEMPHPGYSQTNPMEVCVTDVHIPFLSMVAFMVKWALAAIPAALILICVYFASAASWLRCYSQDNIDSQHRSG